MHYAAPSTTVTLSWSSSEKWTQRWQPTYNYHEEGRLLQYEDTPASSTFQAAWTIGSNTIINMNSSR